MEGQSSPAPSATPPRLATAPEGKNTLDFSYAQDCQVATVRAVTKTNKEVTYWRPWEGVKRTVHPAVPRVRATPIASFKHYIPQLGGGGLQPQPQPTPAGTLYNLTTMAPMTTPYMMEANRTGYMPRLRDLLLTTVTPVMRSEIPPPTSFLPHTSGPPTSRFVAFQPRPYIVRKAGSRISMMKKMTQLERPPMQ